MKRFFFAASMAFLLFACANVATADVKIRQKITMGEQSIETTKMIKGARERTEQKIQTDEETARFMPQIATITQCDLRRTVRLNDRQKLYMIEAFPEMAAAGATPSAPRTKTTTRAGGTVTITYLVTDTGERKTMFGLTARHLKITQEIVSSPDSCGGANRSKMEFDGWYVDFSAEFNCPISVPEMPTAPTKPDCVDRIITKGGGGKTGFLLSGVMKIYDADGRVQMTHQTETLELSRAPLAAELFEVPAGYTQVDSIEQLYKMPSMEDMARGGDDDDQPMRNQGNVNRKSGRRSMGMNLVFANAAKVDQAAASEYLAEQIRARNYNPLPGAGGDYTLKVEFKQVKESTGGKIGGLFGKVTGVETKAGKTDVELVVSLFQSGAPSAVATTRVARKFDGSADAAVREALAQALEEVLRGL